MLLSQKKHIVAFTLAAFFILVFVLTFDLPEPAPTIGLNPIGLVFEDTEEGSVLSRNFTLKFALISDMDKRSKTDGGKYWRSSFKTGYLIRDDGDYRLEWESEKELQSSLSEGGRGMELSELIWFNGDLLTFCDHTGVVFTVKDDAVFPRFILADGDGDQTKGFKSEWATVKDGVLHVGSTGKEWTDQNGTVWHHHRQWIKTVTSGGLVTNADWSRQYSAMRSATNTQFPGYTMHEAGIWRPSDRHWYFLPRRISLNAFDAIGEESEGGNLLIRADEDFNIIAVIPTVPFVPGRGFSSAKFLPGLDSAIVALRTEESSDEDSAVTYLCVFDISGNVLLNDTFVASEKYEGLEFL